jgi:peptidoglycan biosynthesis protein MviN/MurJ (putative lipid II flippase)
MKLQVVQAVLMLFCVWSLGHMGIAWASAAAGLSSGLTTLAALVAISRVSEQPLRRYMVALVRPLVAAVAMAAAVVAVERGLAALGARSGVQLILGIIAGVIVYLPAAFLVAPSASRKLIGRLASGLRRG